MNIKMVILMYHQWWVYSSWLLSSSARQDGCSTPTKTRTRHPDNVSFGTDLRSGDGEAVRLTTLPPPFTCSNTGKYVKRKDTNQIGQKRNAKRMQWNIEKENK